MRAWTTRSTSSCPGARFARANTLWGLAPQADFSWGVLAADFDNDGDDDLYLPRGGFFAKERDKLLRNDIAGERA